MDFTLRDSATGEVTSTIFRDIAEYLSAHGYAVARYNKHYVDGPEDFQGMQAYYQNFTFDLLLEDAGSVYETVRAPTGRPGADRPPRLERGVDRGRAARHH
jgi:hypothetical protein